MRCSSFATGLLGAVVVMLAAPVLNAQTVTPPPFKTPIQSARRAAAATNAHVRAEMNVDPGPATRDSGLGRMGSGPVAARGAKGAPAERSPRDSSSEETGLPILRRESFTYSADGRRDPFVSLMTSGELRPMLSDLKLVVVIYDPAGHSVAVLRDVTTKEQYRVTVGKTLGRMRVTAIQPKSVTFVLEEFGYSRQEVLALNDSTTERAQ